jgi:hypothetical protein
MPISPGYTSVSVERICQPDFEELEIDIPGGDREKTLKDALHGIILWPKRYIVITPRMMDLRETTWSCGRHRQYLLASLYNRLWGRHPARSLSHPEISNFRM